MIDFTNDEQITIIAVVDKTIDDLTKCVEVAPESWKICFGRITEYEISCLKSIREKINEERKHQGRIEL